jgi:hypothetical protein
MRTFGNAQTPSSWGTSRSEASKDATALSHLLDRRGVAGECGAAHVAHLVAVVEAAGAPPRGSRSLGRNYMSLDFALD